MNGVTFEHRGAYPLQSETFPYRDFTGQRITQGTWNEKNFCLPILFSSVSFSPDAFPDGILTELR